MDESENFTPLQKGESPNGHERPLRIVEIGRTILTKRVVVMVEEGSRAVGDVPTNTKEDRHGRGNGGLRSECDLLRDRQLRPLRAAP